MMVSIYEQPIMARLFRMPAVRFKKVIPVDELGGSEYARRPDEESGTAQMHILRLIWHCLLARVAAETGQSDHEAAFEHALSKLDPVSVAILMGVLRLGSGFVSLERSIMECTYSKGRYLPPDVEGWLARSTNQEAAAAVKRVLEDIPLPK